MKNRPAIHICARLIERRDNDYRTGRDDDGEHIAVVIEGGGMRGVAAGGMVSALEKLELRKCFDSVHGSSAGAAAGAYFAAGQANFGTRIFYEDLTDGRFIDQNRALWGRDIMDTSFLVDFVMKKIKPLDFEKLQNDSPPLFIVMTDIDSGDAYIVNEFEDYEHYRSCLKASVTLPFIAGRPKNLAGRRLMDGGLLQQIAIQSAFDVGATQVLALQTRRKDEQFRPEKSWKIWLQSQFIQALYGGNIGKIYQERSMIINESVKQIDLGMASGGQQLFGINLPDSVDYIHRLTKDESALKKAATACEQHVLSIFSDSATSLSDLSNAPHSHIK